MGAVDLIRAGEPTPSAWRFRLHELAWRDLVEALRTDPLPFCGLWCDGADMHALFILRDAPLAVTLVLEDGRYPALSPAREVSTLYERAAYDLYGAEAMWARDVRPLLDHEVWPCSTPLAGQPGVSEARTGLVAFQPSEKFVAATGPVDGWGPASGGVAPPWHVAFTQSGGVIGLAESQSGYAHRGLALRWRGSRAEEACRLSGRLVAGQSVAHQTALCMAVENACGHVVGEKASQARVALLEMERVLHHLYTLADMAERAQAPLVAAHCMMLRETMLEQISPVTGSRLLMDCCRPGGVHLPQAEQMGALCDSLARMGLAGHPALQELWDSFPGLAARLTGLGVTRTEDLARVGLEGPVARAAGQDCDTRRLLGLYDGLWRYTAGRQNGSAADRAQLLLDEIAESLTLLAKLAVHLGDAAPGRETLSLPDAEGMAMVEGPWGRVAYWVWLHQGRLAQVFCHNPAAAALLVFEEAIKGQPVEDLPLLACSLGVNAAALDG
ncbi:NADH-quinone oxidoreductase subunit D [Acetobacter suratthaniensis]|uniref:NADH-quinone oxidoreductase subunit D n=1 Tax=Acetobacter suratthaniensis TaxID=1502841 RepID=A0ABS3LHL8_9PROT|nr:NADH-quinone oxidoreductase subunit D [Acetobacter suratthaniensis]MBO1327086.1 NADH-quinone oxidoreductase subunit D [Acetobacter suratthaniensis]MCX2565303.1 NADH-quinone oxidoreductase subunit D [Acetobacter suratthaniensis]